MVKLFNLTLFVVALAVILCGCRRVIASPRDELVQFGWAAREENGNVLSLSFHDDGAARFTAENSDYTLSLSGLCTVYDDHFVICDTATDSLYSFGYTLHGDCVELTCDDGTVSLDKVQEQ